MKTPICSMDAQDPMPLVLKRVELPTQAPATAPAPCDDWRCTTEADVTGAVGDRVAAALGMGYAPEPFNLNCDPYGSLVFRQRIAEVKWQIGKAKPLS